MCNTPLNLLDKWAVERGSQVAYIFLDSQGKETDKITFKDLMLSAKKIAAFLIEQRFGGERVIISLEPGLEFIIVFLGCLYAKAVAVPIPPPRSKRQLARTQPVIEDSQPKLILANQQISSNFSIQTRSPNEILNDTYKTNELLPQINGKDIAFLQYTSGSTSTPKGVVLTHSHLYNHQQIIERAFNHNQNTKIVGWLPFYHDMGLIGNILQALHLGVTSILMSPMTFIQKPLLWLKAISSYQATTSGGPNFAYDYCLSEISDEELKSLDLSSWKLAFNGSERIVSSTLKSFSKKFKECGFSSDSFFPCYGLAEATLFVTGRNTLLSTSFSFSDNQVTDVVSCGSTFLDEELLIVNPKTLEPCRDQKEGEIWVKGLSVAAGYWNKEDESAKIFNAHTTCGQGPYLRTGDLGFIQNKELFVLGREKNLIILRGTNYFPHDLESCVRNSHPLLSRHSGVAFSLEGKTGETLMILQEVPRSLKRDTIANEIFNSIKEAIYSTFEISPHTIIFVKENSLPRTTSGKLQHFLAKQQFENKLLANRFVWTCDQNNQVNLHANLTEFLAQLLNISPTNISKKTPIITLGLDSLTGAQFLNWIETKFNLSLDLHFLLNGASIEEIEAKVIKTPSTNLVNQISIQKEYPLSWNQKNVWVFNRLNPKSLAYNIFFKLKIKGLLNYDILKIALEKLVDRHPILKTSFAEKQSDPIQVVNESIEIPLLIKNLERCPLGKVDEEIASEIKNEQNYCFDLSSAPLFRLVVLQLTNRKNIILFHFHHIICDGWSIKVFMSELEFIYAALCLNQSINLPLAKASYQNYVFWQQKLRLGNTYGHLERHWKEKLESPEYPVTSLYPFRTDKISIKSSFQSFLLEKDLLLYLQSFIKEKKLTLSVVLMATFHAVLHLYSGENKVYVGYPALNRPEPSFQNIIGFFVNTLVCKTEMNSNISFIDLLEQVKKNIWEQKNESTYPLQDLLDQLRPPRFEYTSPLFQTMFVMQSASLKQTHFANCEIEELQTPSKEILYDLVLEAREKSDHVELIFEHKLDKISEDLLSEIAKSYFTILKEGLSDSRKKMVFYQFLPKDPGLSITNLKKLPVPNDENIITLFEKQVNCSPDKIAIYSDAGNLTYRQLNALVHKISSQILKNKIKLGEPVALCLDRDPYLIASILGILKSGGAYLPIDSNYPNQRIQNIIDDAGPRLIITTEAYHDVFHFFKGTLLNPKKEEESIEAPFIPLISPAYIIYTSGSTGNPKGVVVQHQSLVNFAQSAIQLFSLTNTDKALQFSSINWDTASEEIYPTLLSGASIVLRGKDRIEGFSDLLNRTHNYEITTWNLPSSYWHDLVDKLYREEIVIPPSLRLVIVGGERVNRSKVDLWLNKLASKTKLLNTYGSTETTSISSGYDLSKWKSEWLDSPIGSPINNVNLYVLNSNLQHVPKGVAGDLYIAGMGLAKEYLNQPKLTNQKFVLHPQTNERLYNTGDTAYYSLSGDLLLRGRSDRQIKRRGYRIELDEIETHLRSISEIRNCILTYEKKIIAYLILEENSSISLDTIRTNLREKMPDYLMPDAFIQINFIPRLPNGKIDYLALKSENKNLAQKTPIALCHNNEIEKKVVEIWKQVLNLEDIGFEDSFFDAGGNSLLLIQLHESLQKEFCIEFNISVLFSHFSIQSQSQKIEAIKQACAVN